MASNIFKPIVQLEYNYSESDTNILILDRIKLVSYGIPSLDKSVAKLDDSRSFMKIPIGDSPDAIELQQFLEKVEEYYISNKIIDKLFGQ
jgi:hypothetical protein